MTLAGLAALAALVGSGIAPPPSVPEVRWEACPLDTGPRVSVPACTAPGHPVYVDPSLRRGLRFVIVHELGHHVDYQVLTDYQRAIFRRLVADRRPWRTAPNSPHEKFAEAYALCALRPRGFYRSYGYGYDVSRKRHRRICLFMRRLG